MNRDYIVERFVRCGYKVTLQGKNILVEKGYEKYSGKPNLVYAEAFKKNGLRVIRKLELELERKNEYIKGLEELLYKKHIMSKGA